MADVSEYSPRYAHDGSGWVARAHRLRKLMCGPPNPEAQTAGIQEMVNERIAELTTKLDDDGIASGPEPESG
jgi:hypothetical protein